jgi:hypothetical protein
LCARKITSEENVIITKADIGFTLIELMIIVAILSAIAYLNSTDYALRGYPIARANLNNDTDVTSGIGATPEKPSDWYIDLALSGIGKLQVLADNPQAFEWMSRDTVFMPAALAGIDANSCQDLEFDIGSELNEVGALE